MDKFKMSRLLFLIFVFTIMCFQSNIVSAETIVCPYRNPQKETSSQDRIFAGFKNFCYPSNTYEGYSQVIEFANTHAGKSQLYDLGAWTTCGPPDTHAYAIQRIYGYFDTSPLIGRTITDAKIETNFRLLRPEINGAGAASVSAGFYKANWGSVWYNDDRQWDSEQTLLFSQDVSSTDWISVDGYNPIYIIDKNLITPGEDFQFVVRSNSEELSSEVDVISPALYVTVADEIPTITVLLTFDDGPEGDEYGFNSTSSVLDTLSTNSVQNDIKATFFTLTHGRHWGGTELGESLLIRERNEGHVASIHAGGKGGIGPHFWFARHTWRVRTKPYPVGPNGKILKKGTPVGNTGLESDLVAAIRRLRYLYENPYYNPEFVRPPGYFYNSAVLKAYSSEAVKNELGNTDGLKMILTDTLWGDGGGGTWPPPSIVSAGLKASIKNCIGKGIYEIVLTLHDSNDTTAENLETYLNDIRQAAKEEGYNVKFVDSESEDREILNKRWIAGNWQGK